MNISFNKFVSLFFIVLLTLLSQGCKGVSLLQSPNLYVHSNENPYSDVPDQYQSNEMELLYATDRKPITEDDKFTYGHLRSRTLAYGTCTVAIGEDVPWDDIVAASRTDKRSIKLPLLIKEVKELGRYPDPTTPQVLVKGKHVDPSDYLAALKASEKELQNIVGKRLGIAKRKEVFLFIHGVMNAYDNSAYGMATLWHFLGRPGVPIFYSWPARRDSRIVRGYNYDRESGEFTVFHLKQFLKTLATTPGLEKIHVIAHSRGTDILTSAVRELHIYYSAKGRDTRKELKMGTIILAAADLDMQVTRQRITAERLGKAAERYVFYVSSEDSVIGMSEWLYGDASSRVGQLEEDDIEDERLKILKKQNSVQIIDVKITGSRGFMGHTYFIENPAVLSDLILVLRDNKLPGKKYGRPLIQNESGFWELHDGYPNMPVKK